MKQYDNIAWFLLRQEVEEKRQELIKVANTLHFYKKVLLEIKEIAKEHKTTANCNYLEDMEKILEKIKECGC